MRTPLKQGPLKPCPCDRARNSMQDRLNHFSVRPNPTIVFSILRFDFFPTLRPSEKHGLDGLKNHLPDKRKFQLVPFILDLMRTCHTFTLDPTWTIIFLLSGRCFVVNSIRQKDKRPAPIRCRLSHHTLQATHGYT